MTYWAVNVSVNGDSVVSIEVGENDGCLSGKEHLSETELDCIRQAGQHLLSFARPEETQCFACGGVEACEDNCPLQAGM